MLNTKCSIFYQAVRTLVMFNIKIISTLGGAMLGQLVDSDYLLDFDIFHVSHVTELLHYVDAKYLSSELGGTNNIQVDTWLNIQVRSHQYIYPFMN